MLLLGGRKLNFQNEKCEHFIFSRDFNYEMEEDKNSMMFTISRI